MNNNNLLNANDIDANSVAASSINAGSIDVTTINATDINADNIDADYIDAFRLGYNGGIIYPQTSSFLRLISPEGVVAFIDSDNDQTDRAFIIYHNNSSLTAPGASIFSVAENGRVEAHGDIDLNDNNLLNTDNIVGENEYIDFMQVSGAARGIRVAELGVDSSYNNADLRLDALGGNSLWVEDHIQTGGSLYLSDVDDCNIYMDGTGNQNITMRCDATYNHLYIAPYGGPGKRFEDVIIGGAGDMVDLHVSGDLGVGGSCLTGALVESNLQTEEELEAGQIERFTEGDVLCWGIDRLELCSTANDRLVQAVADAQGRPIVIGAELVHVLGPVQRGDILVSSDVPGYAMVNNDPVSGSVIAQALEDFDGEQGLVRAMIRKW